MKKKCIVLIIALLGIFIVTSCTIYVPYTTTVTTHLDPDYTAEVPALEYTNMLEKGNSVDSIVLYQYNNSIKKKITISSSDTYTEMINKLYEINNKLTFTIRKNDINTEHAFCEQLSKVNIIYTKKQPTFIDGEIVDGYFHSESVYKANTVAYIPNSFFVGSISRYSREKSEKSIKETAFEDYKKGLFYNYQGNDSNGSIELATDMRNFNLLHRDNIVKTQEAMDNLKGFYYTINWQNDNYPAKTYKTKYSGITFDNSRLRQYRRQTQTSWFFDNMYSFANTAYLSKLDISNQIDYVKEYFDLSFELTDKYLIIKNRINVPNHLVRAIVQGNNYTIAGFNRELGNYDDSYSEKEIWINYNDYIDDGTTCHYGYDYYNVTELETTQDMNSDSLDNYGTTEEEHYETYIIELN